MHTMTKSHNKTINVSGGGARAGADRSHVSQTAGIQWEDARPHGPVTLAARGTLPAKALGGSDRQAEV